MDNKRLIQARQDYDGGAFAAHNYLKISLIKLSAFFSFCTIFSGIYLIKRYVPFASGFQMIFAGITMLIFLRHCLHYKLHIPKCAMILLIDAAYVLIVSLIKGQSFMDYLSMLVPILVVCSTLMTVLNQNDLLNVLRVWCTCTFTVVMIDLGTMFIWPNGMYKTRYPINWFLGYKTHRLEYSFTLLVLYTCYSLLKYKRLKKSMFFVSLIVVADTYLSRASGAALAVTAYVVILFIVRNQLKEKHSGRSGRFTMFMMKRYRLIFCIYLAVTAFLVVLNDTGIMSKIASIFNKSVTFSGRVKIWMDASSLVKNSPVFGNGVLSASQYSDELGFNNPHNMLYSYIITGGIVGTVILFLAFGFIFSMMQDDPGKYYIGLYVYCVFMLGLVSSAMAFSPYFFAILMLVPVLKRVERKTPSEISGKERSDLRCPT